jgi:hypothetical protein
MLKQIEQDMTVLTHGILFHQVNCQGIMGGGIARAFARKFPDLEPAYKTYIDLKIKGVDPEFRMENTNEDGHLICKADFSNKVLLGRAFIHPVSPELMIANIFGQGYISTMYRMTNYDAVVTAFESVRKWLDDHINGLPTYFPYKMGCGLGGGHWRIYSAIIEEFFPEGIVCKYGS